MTINYLCETTTTISGISMIIIKEEIIHY